MFELPDKNKKIKRIEKGNFTAFVVGGCGCGCGWWVGGLVGWLVGGWVS